MTLPLPYFSNLCLNNGGSLIQYWTKDYILIRDYYIHMPLPLLRNNNGLLLCKNVKSFLTNAFSHHYQLDESPFIFRDVRSDFYFYLIFR